MRRLLLLTAICFLILHHQEVTAQAAGDYRSAGSGAWDEIAWQYYNGTAWVGAAAAPDTAAGQIHVRNGDTVRVEAPTTADQLVVDTGGALIINIGAGLTLADGAGEDLVIYGNTTIANGSFVPPGTVMVQPAGTLIFNDAVSSYVGGNITNNGTIVWSSGDIGFGANSSITNNASLLITGNNIMQNGIAFPGELVNNGTITKVSSGTTQFNISDGFTNNGTINFNAGVISSYYTFTNTGDLIFNSGSFIHLSTFDHNGGTVAGAGTFTNSGLLNLNIDQEFPPTVSFVMEANATTTGPGDLTLNQDFVFASNIRINGPGLLTIHGNTDWNSGRIGRSFTVEPGRSLKLATADGKVVAAPIVNNGTMDWQEGDILFYANTVLTNNGTLIISGNNELRNGDSFSAFSNTGTLTKTSSGTTTFSAFNGFTNTGTINLNAGLTITNYPFTNTGNLNFHSGDFIHESTFDHNGGSITGTGHFTNSGSLHLNVDQEFPATLIFAMDATTTTDGPGNLTLNQDFVIEGNILGTGALTIHGNTLWNSRRIGRAFTNEAGRTLTLATSAGKLIAGPITNKGTMDWQEGDILFYANTALTNNGTLIISGDNEIRNGDNIGTLANSGTISKTSTGTTDFTLSNFSNDSAGVIKGKGIINMNPATSYVNNGVIAPGLSPGILELDGRQPFSANSTLQIELQDAGGAGTGHDQLIRDGSLQLAGTLTVTEAGTVPTGTYTIIRLTAGNISDTFSRVHLPIGYSVVTNPDNVQLVKHLVVTPVKLVSFTAASRDNKVLLRWTTENEINNKYFDIERSGNGASFASIGHAPADTITPGRKEYSFTDQQPLNAINYYRLRQVDIDGRSEYSPVVTAAISRQEDIILLYPNPVKDVLHLRFNKTSPTVSVSVTDIQGRQLISRQVHDPSLLQLPVRQLASGIYYIKATDAAKTVVLSFVKE